MISVDQFTSVLTVLFIGGGIGFLCLQIGRFFGELRGIVKDSREVVQNVSEVSNLAVTDYKRLRSGLKDLVTLLEGASGVASLTRLFKRFKNKKETKEEAKDK